MARPITPIEQLRAAAGWEARQVSPVVELVPRGVWFASPPKGYKFSFMVEAPTKPEVIAKFQKSLEMWLLIGAHPETTNPRWWPEEWCGFENPCPCPRKHQVLMADFDNLRLTDGQRAERERNLAIIRTRLAELAPFVREDVKKATRELLDRYAEAMRELAKR